MKYCKKRLNKLRKVNKVGKVIYKIQKTRKKTANSRPLYKPPFDPIFKDPKIAIKSDKSHKIYKKYYKNVQ